MYRFTKKFERNGVSISKGVVLDRNVVTSDSDCVSVVGSSVLKDIPLEYLEKFEPIKYKKSKTQSKKQSNTQSDKKDVNSRVSTRPDLLKSS